MTPAAAGRPALTGGIPAPRVGLMAIQTVRTMCPMNCHPTLCGMLVDVEDGATKLVLKKLNNIKFKGRKLAVDLAG